mmetsp:Transcript_145415/g.362652  ORF Transcript_145415/g.362652 Transcript_145415/m.362652 type:complete len:89 (+) Transcript_145415:1123-1389(+)
MCRGLHQLPCRHLEEGASVRERSGCLQAWQFSGGMPISPSDKAIAEQAVLKKRVCRKCYARLPEGASHCRKCSSSDVRDKKTSKPKGK